MDTEILGVSFQKERKKNATLKDLSCNMSGFNFT